MRYAEGPEASVSVEVDARIEVLWSLVTDLDLPARFSDEFEGATWLDGAEAPQLGARFRGRNHNSALGSWEVTCTVVELEEGRRFGWAVGDPSAPAATWRYEIEQRPDGLLLTHWGRMGPGPSGLTPMIAAQPEREEAIVEMRLGMWLSNMQATVEGIKQLAEAGG